MEEKKLYPLKFCPIKDKYSWGEETFELADLGYRDSFILEGWLASNGMGDVMDTYMERVVGDKAFEYFGRQFPVCIKRIKVNGRMPLVVHPDDEVAEQRYDQLGKEKLWYVISCGKGASIEMGFRNDTDASEFYAACADGSVGKLLNVVAPHPGQFFNIKPGTVHSASGDIEILEISESSPLDFCLCTFGERQEEDQFDASLGLEAALDIIDYKAYRSRNPESAEKTVIRIADTRNYQVNTLCLDSPLHIYLEKFESFVLYTCISGSASVQFDVEGRTVRYGFKKGESLLVPAECPDFVLTPEEVATIVLETNVPPIEEIDSYTGEVVEKQALEF